MRSGEEKEIALSHATPESTWTTEPHSSGADEKGNISLTSDPPKLDRAPSVRQASTESLGPEGDPSLVENAELIDDDDPVPDGGLTAWLQVLGSWVIAVDTWGIVNSYGVFQTYYQRELLTSRSASDLSWVGSLQAALLMLVGAIAGPAYDAGYFREMLCAGLFLIILGQFMTSLCTTYWQVLLAQGICVGLGCGLVFLPSAAILSQYFLKRRSFVLGIASTGSPIASAVFPILLGKLIPKIGFGWATRVLAFVMLALSIIPVFFMRMRRKPPPGHVRSLIDKTALRDVPFLLLMVGILPSFLTIYVGFFYIQSYAINFDITTPDFSPYLVTFLGVGSILGRLIPNYLADKIGTLNVLLSSGIMSAVLCFAWLGIRSLGGLITFAVLYGASSGGLVSVTPSATVALTPDLSVVGTRMGMLFFATGIAVVIGPPIAGAIVGAGGVKGWMGAIGYSAAGLFLGAVVFLAARIVLFNRTRNWRA